MAASAGVLVAADFYGFENVTLQKGTRPILILNIIDRNVNVNVKFNVKFV